MKHLSAGLGPLEKPSERQVLMQAIEHDGPSLPLPEIKIT